MESRCKCSKHMLGRCERREADSTATALPGFRKAPRSIFRTRSYPNPQLGHPLALRLMLL